MCRSSLRPMPPGDARSPWLLRLALLALGAGALSGCGQTGPLTLPDRAGAGAAAAGATSASEAPNETEEPGEDGAENER